MAPKAKEHPVIVEPTSGDGVEYEVIRREVIENAHRKYPDVKSDPYDEVVLVRRKICRGNPEEVFDTYETVRYRKYHVVTPLPTEIKLEAKTEAVVNEKS